MIVTITHLTIKDVSETIYYSQAIFNFTILTKYLLYNNKLYFYIEYALYKLDIMKIAFKKPWPINAKLFPSSFYHPKLYVMTHFVKCIGKYGSAINHDIRYNKTSYKYLLKIFYRRTHKKEYKSQILYHNIRYTNVIILQNTILNTKLLNGSTKKNSLLMIHLIQRSRRYTIQPIFR